MKNFRVICNERKREYERWLTYTAAHYLDYAKTLDYFKRKEYMSQIEEEKQFITDKLNNPTKFEEEVRKEISFDAINYLKAMKYIVENGIDIDTIDPNEELSRSELSDDEKITLTGYFAGQATFGFSDEDYEDCGGQNSPNFFKNMVSKINSEYNVTIPIEDKDLTVNRKASKKTI